MKGKLLLLGGAAAGYVLGTRAGRERYEQIKAGVSKAWNDPNVQQKVTEAEDVMREKSPEVKAKVADATHQAAESAKGAAQSASDRVGGKHSGPTEDTGLPPQGVETATRDANS